jgi:isopentenyl diphosphate isomerase/L-lactate dehydrogenase-like FMN-dependent dehydrogenase
MLQMAASPFSWDDIKWIKQIWNKKLVVKGILSGSDAKKAVDSGADAVVISNHGGRQLEGVSPTFMMLPEIVSSVNKNAEVILDSGIRRGSHVLKALALGANAVMIGRPYLYGLAVNGQKGVENILEIFKTELIRDMNLLGCKNLEALDETFLIKKSQFQF